MLKKLNIISVNPLANMELLESFLEEVTVENVPFSELHKAFGKDQAKPAFEGFLPADWASYVALTELGVCTPFPDHASLRETLSGTSINQPNFRILDDDVSVLDSLNPPLLVHKGISERFVEYVDDVSLAVKQLHKEVPTNDQIVVEEILEGEGYSLFIHTHAFEFPKKLLEQKNFLKLEWNTGRGQYPMAMTCPAEPEQGLHQKIMESIAEVISHLDGFSDYVRMDFVVRDGEPYLRTVDPCVISPWMPVDLLDLSCSSSLFDDVLREAVQLLPEENTATPRGAALRWLEAGSGLVEDIRGVEFAERMEGVVRLHVGVKPGDRLRHVVDTRDRDRVGYVVAVGDSAEEAQAIAERAAKCIQIETKTYIESSEFS